MPVLLPSSEQRQVPGLLTDDQAACSFTDDSIYQLSTITVPGSGSGRDLGQLVGTVTLWATRRRPFGHRAGTAARYRPVQPAMP